MLTVFRRFLERRSRAASKHRAAEEGAQREGPRVPQDVRVSVEEDGLVFLHIGEGKLFRSNASGRRIWQLLLEHRSVPAIAEQLSAEYGVPAARIERDAHTFVTDLRRAGLVTICNQE
jgi:hypothetical protein